MTESPPDSPKGRSATDGRRPSFGSIAESPRDNSSSDDAASPTRDEVSSDRTRTGSFGSKGSALSAFMGNPRHRRKPSGGTSITSIFVPRSERAPSIRSMSSDAGSGGHRTDSDQVEDSITPITDSPSVPSSTTSNAPRHASIISMDEAGTPINGYGEEEFLIARLEEQKRAQTPQPEGAKKASYWPSAYLQASFQAVRESFTGEGKGAEGKTVDGKSPEDKTAEGEDEGEQIDWGEDQFLQFRKCHKTGANERIAYRHTDFWGKVMNDYETTARKHPRTFTKKLQQGIPDAIRGMVWQLMCKGKSPDLEAQYAHLLTRTSIHEKIIQRDLARTFPKHERFVEPMGPGQESLFNIIKAYSLYDPEIGYCQGIAFIVGALLLNMPDEEAFCVLVRLMKDYNLRELYTPQMTGLQLRLYQYDKLLEELFPAVHKHLEQQDVKSTMYASPWFMTMFAYRFPLNIVFRIMDIVFAEGVDSMLRFALALIKRNVDHILTLDFEPALEFLKNGLFDVYGGSVAALIIDASSVRVTKHRLDKLAVEFTDMMRKASPEAKEVQRLEIDNRRLMETVRRMEAEFEQLNKEHIELANKLLEVRVQHDEKAEEVERLRRIVDESAGAKEVARKEAEVGVKEEMDRLAVKNLELTHKNAELVDEVAVLQDVLRDTKTRFAECENERGELLRKWNGLRKALG
ncbi:GTPase-activating protein [Rhizophlyctis rosea]|nr:GTPase-activating protein [Rhizophlyctis rosea]